MQKRAIQIFCMCGSYLISNRYNWELVLHSDNGSSMKDVTILATMQKMGALPSFSRPSVSNDNHFPESFFKTLKYTHP